MNLYSVFLGNNNGTTRNCFIKADTLQEAIIKAKEKYLQEENITLDVITVWNE